MEVIASLVDVLWHLRRVDEACSLLTRPLELLPLLTLATLRLPPLAAPSPNGLGGPTPDAAAIVRPSG